MPTGWSTVCTENYWMLEINDQLHYFRLGLEPINGKERIY